ncbi:MAG: MMPL family transporter [Azospirillaceae bacterium]
MSPRRGFVAGLEAALFGRRRLVLALFVLVTAALAVGAARLGIDAGFEKRLPLDHPYMETFLEYQDRFGGANRVLVALAPREGDIFQPAFFETLEAATDAVFFVPGVDRARVRSIFTPNVRYVEVVEDGFSGGNVIPADFEPTPEALAEVRENILKSGEVGRLVAEDFSAAIVSAELLDRDPETGEPLDYIAVSEELEALRDRFEGDDVSVHIIGFPMVVGDVAEGAAGVVGFFAVAVAITALLVRLYSGSWRLTALPIVTSLVAVVWQAGLLTWLGYGLDPMSILVPFLVFAIGVSHGVQMINAVGAEVAGGRGGRDAARAAFARLAVPGTVALASDTIGFLTLLLIGIPMIQELAITASLGVAALIATNLVLLPILIGEVGLPAGYAERSRAGAARRAALWHRLSGICRPGPAAAALGVAVVLFAIGLWGSQGLAIGDRQAGVPELRPDSRYNQDTRFITDHFAIGVDILTVITEGPANGCIDHPAISALDDFAWAMANEPGVQSTLALSTVMKTVNAGWNEGHLAWHVLPRNQYVLVQAVRPVETSTGLLNADCSVMPVMIFTEDHKAETISGLVEAVKTYRAEHPDDPLTYRLATGNVGVMAATNEAVSAAQVPMLGWVYAAIVALCLVTFRSIRATLCTVLPLGLVSVLCYALMAALDMGLKVSTLPVAALGVGIGVDYGIYIFSRLRGHLEDGEDLRTAYFHTLQETGAAVLLTGATLAIGVSTWIFSALQFQADMGLLLAFLFGVNMLGAVLLLPALAALIDRVMPWRRDR